MKYEKYNPNKRYPKIRGNVETAPGVLPTYTTVKDDLASSREMKQNAGGSGRRFLLPRAGVRECPRMSESRTFLLRHFCASSHSPIAAYAKSRILRLD